MNCEWESLGVVNGRPRVRCVRCGREAWCRDIVRCFARCGRPCDHLGETRGTLKVLCRSCHGGRESEHTVCECRHPERALRSGRFGRCLPFFAPKDEAAEAWYGDAAKGIAPREESAIYQVCATCPLQSTP